jgi:hypothetical protein
LISRSVEIAAGRALRTFGLDRAATRLRMTDVLERAGLKLGLSEIVARLLFWLLMLTFVLSSVEALGLTAVTATIDRLIAYVPSLIGAALITVVGLVLARFVGTLVSSAAAAAGLAFALGAYPIVTHILAGHFLKESLPRDTFVEVEGERG